MYPFTIEQVSDLTAALKTLAKRPEARLIAGGTTLIDLMKLEVERPRHLIDITRLGLDRIETEGDVLRFGALAKMSDVADDPVVRADYPAISESLWLAASAQLRNMATIAGNILQRTRCAYFRDVHTRCNKRQPGSGCDAIDGYNRMHAVLGASEHCVATHPSDFCVTMAAFDAQVEVASLRGKRMIPFADFHLLPGEHPEREHALAQDEIVLAVQVAKTKMGRKSCYVKVRDRESYEFALVSAAVVLDLDGDKVRDVRIALGGVATKPWRCREAEMALIGEKCNDQNIANAAMLAMTGAKSLSHNAFKVGLSKRTVVEAIKIAVERGK